MKEKPAGGSPFFDIMFNFINFHIYNSLALDSDQDYKKSLEEEINEDSFELTNTALDFTANARGSSLTLTLKLKKGLKNGATLEKIQYYVETILVNYLENSDAIISEIDYLTDAEKQLFLSASSAYVVDQQLNLCPAGIPGELLISEKRAAGGALNQPELSEQQFINIRFRETEERVYRTGNLGRLLPDGNIEFLGRIENQNLIENTDDQLKRPAHQAEPEALERNELEASIGMIWEKILEYKGIGIYDNFFRIGGDSILVVKLKHELGKAFNKPVNLVDLFNHTTIADQARLFAENVELDKVSEINELKF